MLAAVIDNGSTWLLDIRDNLDIDQEQLRNEWRNRYVGWLVNTDSMPDIIGGMPICRFMLKLPDNTLEDISVKQAHQVLEGLVDLRKKLREERGYKYNGK